MDLAALRKLTPVMVTSTLARCVPRDSLETHLPVGRRLRLVRISRILVGVRCLEHRSQRAGYESNPQASAGNLGHGSIVLQRHPTYKVKKLG